MSDELPPEVARLIASERASAGPSPSERRAVRAAVAATLGMGVAASAGSTTSAAAATTTSTAAVTGAVIAKVTIAAVLIGGGSYALLRDPPVRPVPVSIAVPQPARDSPAPMQIAAQLPAAPAVMRPPVVSHARPAKPAAPITPSVSPSIEPQSALLSRAWARLADGDAAAALVIADEDAQAHPTGALSEERDALRIEALMRLGHDEPARTAAQAFFTRYPNSLHRAAIEQMIAP